MPMSEHELKVLEQLEHEFRPPPLSRASSRYARISAPKRVAAAILALPCALLLAILGTSLNDAGGVVLALLSYALLVCSLAILVDCSSRVRAALVRPARSRPAPRKPRNYW